MKNCSVCKIEKDDSEFSKNQFRCKSCAKQYKLDHKDEIKEKDKQYRLENKNSIQEYNKQYYLDNKNSFKDKNHIYYVNNKESLNRTHNEYNKSYFKTKYANNLSFKLRRTVSIAIWQTLTLNGSSKSGLSCLDYLQYSVGELKSHLEDLFEPWMSWDNYGKYDRKTWNDNDPTTWTWSLDHIIPQSDLPYTSMSEDNFKKCWELNNLRPLSAKQNLIDGNRRSYEFGTQKSY